MWVRFARSTAPLSLGLRGGATRRLACLPRSSSRLGTSQRQSREIQLRDSTELRGPQSLHGTKYGSRHSTTKGLTSPIRRWIVSKSYGAGSQTITASKPAARNAPIRSAIC